MLLPSLLGHSAELFRIIRKSPQPADALASEYFRSKKYIGSKERRFVSETVFAALRLLSAAEHCALTATRALSPEQADLFLLRRTLKKPQKKQEVFYYEMSIIASACLIGGETNALHISQLLEIMFGVLTEPFTEMIGTALAVHLELPVEAGYQWAMECLVVWQELIRQADTILVRIASGDEPVDEDIHVLAVRAAIQPWILRAWKDDPWHKRSWQDAVALGISLFSGAPLCLRVNTMLASREEVAMQLERQGIFVTNSTISPVGLISHKRADLRQNDLFIHGMIEIQDDASQLVAYALDPSERWRILDACAGAGGKSLHIAVLQHDRGEVLAADIEYNRLKELPHRVHRAGLQSIHILPLGRQTKAGDLSEKLVHLKEHCDAVVVDAPCSGMGTVRRMPMAKWRLTPELLRKHAVKQLAVVETYAQCVRPGGVLIYSTCSIMPDENDAVVQEFLRRHPEFTPEPLAEVFHHHGIVIPHLSPEAATLTLTPATDLTDGFFIARMRHNA